MASGGGRRAAVRARQCHHLIVSCVRCWIGIARVNAGQGKVAACVADVRFRFRIQVLVDRRGMLRDNETTSCWRCQNTSLGLTHAARLLPIHWLG